MWNKQNIQELLESNPKAVLRAVTAIYALQTAEEQASKSTKLNNGVGFGAFDAEFMSDMAKRINKGYELSPKQFAVAKNKIKHYHRQLSEIANADAKHKPVAVESDAGNLAEAMCVTNEYQELKDGDIIW